MNPGSYWAANSNWTDLVLTKKLFSILAESKLNKMMLCPFPKLLLSISHRTLLT